MGLISSNNSAVQLFRLFLLLIIHGLAIVKICGYAIMDSFNILMKIENITINEFLLFIIAEI